VFLFLDSLNWDVVRHLDK